LWKLAVIEFFWKEEIPTLDIHTQLHCAYENSCMHSNNVRQWVKHFKDGNADIASQLCTGDLRCACTERNKGKIKGPTRENLCVTLREMSADTGVEHSTIWEELESSGYCKVCAWWVSHLLLEEHKL
jgi:hypothetical protein